MTTKDKKIALPVIKYMLISELKLLSNNPRTISEKDFKVLKKSIADNPDYFNARPCLVNNATGENIVYACNQRLQAAKALGWLEVPCIVESLTIEKQQERTIRDNIQQGLFDFDMLANEWDVESLKEWGLKLDFSDNKKEKLQDEELTLDPYKKVHILLSFAPENLQKIEAELEKIKTHTEIEFLQYAD